MIKAFGRAMLVASLAWCGDARGVTEVFPDAEWSAVDPAAAIPRWHGDGLERVGQLAKQLSSSALFVVQGGRVVYSWGRASTPLPIHSVRKSLLSALYGPAVAKGQIDLRATLRDLKIDDVAPGLTPTETAATVRDLLEARSGVYHPAAYETASMQKNRPPRGSHAPGTFWYYNNWDFNALGAIFKQRTGVDVFAAFAAQLAAPLRLQDFRAADAKWVSEEVSRYPAYTFRLSARDLARIGYLYLRRGRWRDAQIVPTAWIDESLTAYSDANPGVGYGYLWWIAQGTKQFGAPVGKRSFSARGNHGQYVIVAPDLDLVVVHLRESDDARFGSREMGRILRALLAARGGA
jgi:CubicO group peptidase (beta-lactamase class C family)